MITQNTFPIAIIHAIINVLTKAHPQQFSDAVDIVGKGCGQSIAPFPKGMTWSIALDSFVANHDGNISDARMMRGRRLGKIWYGGNTPDDQTPPLKFPCKAEHRKQCSSCMTSQSSETACVVFRIPKWMWNIPSSDLTARGTFHLKRGGPKRKKHTQKKPEMSKSCRLYIYIYIYQWSLTAWSCINSYVQRASSFLLAAYILQGSPSGPPPPKAE